MALSIIEATFENPKIDFKISQHVNEKKEEDKNTNCCSLEFLSNSHIREIIRKDINFLGRTMQLINDTNIVDHIYENRRFELLSPFVKSTSKYVIPKKKEKRVSHTCSAKKHNFFCYQLSALTP